MMQNNYKIIGITGGIATGKSTAVDIIKRKGYKLVDADQISREVVEKNKPAYNKIVEEFGIKVLKEDKSINREKLGTIIFSDDRLRKKLNNIVHPYIFESIRNKIKEYSKTENHIFIDIPLLIEERDKFKEYEIHFDEIWLVYIDEKLQLSRLMKRDSIDKKLGLEKIESQMPIELKKSYATKIIDNSGDLKALNKKMNKVLKNIMI